MPPTPRAFAPRRQAAGQPHALAGGPGEAHRQFLRAVGGNLRELMLSPRIAEPLEQRAAVGGAVGAGQRDMQQRGIPLLLDPACDDGVAECVRDREVTAQKPHISQQRVRTVEQQQLALLLPNRAPVGLPGAPGELGDLTCGCRGSDAIDKRVDRANVQQDPIGKGFVQRRSELSRDTRCHLAVAP